jgi:hypothetical protein
MICNLDNFTMLNTQHWPIKDIYMKFVSPVQGRYLQRILFSSESKKKNWGVENSCVTLVFIGLEKKLPTGTCCRA